VKLDPGDSLFRMFFGALAGLSISQTVLTPDDDEDEAAVTITCALLGAASGLVVGMLADLVVHELDLGARNRRLVGELERLGRELADARRPAPPPEAH
jgi:hypothetical protein